MIKKLNILLILFLISSCASAQMGYGTKSKKAIKLYNEARKAPRENRDPKTGQPDFEKGIDLLKKALNKDNNFLEAHQLIGEFYRLNGQYKKAVEHYKRALAINPADNLNGQLFLDIGDLQMRNGEYKDAIVYFDKVLNSPNRNIPHNVIATSRLEKASAVFSVKAMQHPLDIKLVNIGKGINTKYPEYFPTLTVDGETMLFTRLLPVNNPIIKGQEDFFVSHLNDQNVWETAKPMPPNINTSRNEGAPTLSADGRTLIFVACSDLTGKYGPQRDGKGSCDLFVTHKIGDQWTNPKNLPGGVNTYTWESQPSLSSDGKTLYFIRRVGGRGTRNSDIFVSHKQEDGSWSKAVPLPDNINTPARESSVMIHPDGQTLYFASDGHVGLGGTDLYMSRKDPLGHWGDPVNLGYPINTKANENSLLVGPDGKIAYFASDRPGGEGKLDIYSFELPKSLRPIKTNYFKGLVYDALTKKPLAGKFELIDLATGKQVVQSSADKVTGKFLLALPTEKNYALHVSYPGYSFFSKNFNMIKDSGNVNMNVPLLPITDTKPIRLANVFFDLNKATLRKESFVELNKLLQFLHLNPKISIEIDGHTDSRGSKELNMNLSENRAKAVYDYLITKGIDENRLSYKGFGSTHPIIPDAKIDEMSSEAAKEKAYQENRRVEYKILH